MNFPSHIFFNDINHVYRGAILKKKFCGCFHFIWLWLLISSMKRWAERCALQLYQTSVRLLLGYLTPRKHGTKIGSSFSSWCHINTGVPQRSNLGPLLFNIFINDLFFSIQKSGVCNFADDNTLFCGDKDLDLVFLNLNSDLSNAMDWFKINSLRANPGKFQFLVL